MPAHDARAREIVARLSAGNASSDEVFTAFEELDQLPADVVRQAFEPWTGPAPDLERLDDTMRRAHRLPLRTPMLQTLSSTRDADVLDLGPTAEAQLRIAGKTWDGQDLEPEERLDGEREDTFAGTLELRVLGERDRRMFDVVLFLDGAGVIFLADTTTIVGSIVDHRVETTDRTARAALEQALASNAAPSAAPPSLSEAITLRQPQLELGFVEPPAPIVEVVAEPPRVEAVEEDAAEEEAPAPPKKKAAAKTAKASPGKKTAAAAPAPKKKTAAKAKASSKKAAAADDEAPAPKKKAAAAKTANASPGKKTAAKKKTAAE